MYWQWANRLKILIQCRLCYNSSYIRKYFLTVIPICETISSMQPCFLGNFRSLFTFSIYTSIYIGLIVLQGKLTNSLKTTILESGLSTAPVTLLQTTSSNAQNFLKKPFRYIKSENPKHQILDDLNSGYLYAHYCFLSRLLSSI